MPQIPKPTNKKPTNANGKPFTKLPKSEGDLVKNSWINMIAKIRNTPPKAKVMIPLIAFNPNESPNRELTTAYLKDLILRNKEELKKE